MFYISPVERYILESLIPKANDYNGIKKETGLSDRHLKNALKSLKEKELLSFVSQVYMINKANPALVENKNIEKEILLKTCINSSCQTDALIFSLGAKDEKIFNNMLNSIKDFIRENQIKNEQVKNKKVFFWGQQKYYSAIKSLI